VAGSRTLEALRPLLVSSWRVSSDWGTDWAVSSWRSATIEASNQNHFLVTHPATPGPAPRFRTLPRNPRGEDFGAPGAIWGADAEHVTLYCRRPWDLPWGWNTLRTEHGGLQRREPLRVTVSTVQAESLFNELVRGTSRGCVSQRCITNRPPPRRALAGSRAVHLRTTGAGAVECGHGRAGQVMRLATGAGRTPGNTKATEGSAKLSATTSTCSFRSPGIDDEASQKVIDLDRVLGALREHDAVACRTTRVRVCFAPPPLTIPGLSPHLSAPSGRRSLALPMARKNLTHLDRCETTQ
jgi:hypothetical protein